MTDQLLGVFKICLLALLYLFFARVLWAVWSEVRGPKQQVMHRAGGDPTAAAPMPAPQAAAHAAQQAPHVAPPSGPKPAKGRGGRVGRMTVIEPRARKGIVFALAGELTVGRATGCTVSITDDTFISQLHARVFEQDGETFVEDLNSTNGTYLNGQRLSRVMPLSKGDRVQIGNTVLEAD